jgi:hypothetical protein
MLIMPRIEKISYACVSTEDQTVALQFDAAGRPGEPVLNEWRGRIDIVQRYLDRLIAVAALAAVMGGCLERPAFGFTHSRRS